MVFFFFFSSRRRHTRFDCDWSSDVCSSDLAWIIVAAVFLYKISVKTGQFDVIRSSILSVTPDQRLQLILVGFCFGAFLEGAAGFGAPVAITAALLVGLGFKQIGRASCRERV